MHTKWVFAFLLLLALVFSACASSTSAPTATPLPTPTATSAPKVQLEYIGHSSTLITAPDGTRIISDPYGSERPQGLAVFPAGMTADVITISHFHPDHASLSGITGPNGSKPKILQAPESYQAGQVKITGLASDHGEIAGKPQGDNTVFVFEIGDVKIVHMGAAGVVSQPEVLAAMDGADAVMVDFHGDVVHPHKEMLKQLEGLNVGVIIPGHYSFDPNALYYGSLTLDDLLAVVPSTLPVVRQENSVVEVGPNMTKELLVLSPAANK